MKKVAAAAKKKKNTKRQAASQALRQQEGERVGKGERVECSDADVAAVAPLKTNKQLKMRCSFNFRRGAACLNVVLTFNFGFHSLRVLPCVCVGSLQN